MRVLQIGTRSGTLEYGRKLTEMMDSLLSENLCVGNIAVMSGIRPAGRTVNSGADGRKSNGLLYIWSGAASFRDEHARTVTVTDRELLFLPKHKKYRMEYTAPATTFVLVNFDAFSKSGDDLILSDDIALLAKDDEFNRIARIMTGFELCGASKSVSSALRKKELLYKLLGAAYASGMSVEAGSGKPSQIFEGVRLLEETYLENLPISRYAEASHISINSFRSLFHKQYGMTPLQYRNHLRIERARELLSDGSYTVIETAYASGFENIGYFCRFYKRVTGETPSQTKNKRTPSE